MRVLIFGVCGMAGHMVALYLIEKGYEVVGFARKQSPVCKTIIGDAFETEKVREEIQNGCYDAVINCIGVLNKMVDENLATGIFINSYFPHFLAQCCDQCGIKLIHISTDCVFSGKASAYIESDIPDETSYYGRTKFLGEVSHGKHLCMRTSIIGPELKEDGIGLFQWFMNQEKEVSGYAHAMWSGVTTLELAKAIKAGIEQGLTGLYFLTNNEGISKYELLKLFNQYYRENKMDILRVEEPISSKVLICTRKDFSYSVQGYKTMIEELRAWMELHESLYERYL